MKKAVFLLLFLSSVAFSQGSYFVDNLTTAWKTDKVLIVLAPLGYQSESLGYIEVPAGFETDLASVMRVPVVYTLWGGRASSEAVLHDYLYRIDSVPTVTREQADDAFLEAMEIRGASWAIRCPMYWGVRIGGGSSYHKKSVNAQLF